MLRMAEPTIDSFRLRLDEQRQVVVEFGQRSAATGDGVPADPAGTFVTAHRLVMTPTAAWRLVDGLALALGRPVAALAGEPARPTQAARASEVPAPPPVPPRAPRVGATLIDLGADESLHRRGTTPVNAPPDPAGDKASWLLAAVTEMAPKHHEERSFRIAPQSLQAHRFLLSISSRQLPADALERAWGIARHLGLPATLRPQVDAAYARADHLHFGFEGEPGRVMCKLYFERAIPGQEAAQAEQTGEPALQYVAFKWNVDSGEHVVSHYHWHAGLGTSAIAQRMAAIWGDGEPASLAMSQSVLDLAAARLSAQRLQYLEVSEGGQPRRSFDLNLYDANLQVRDLQSILFGMRDHFDIRPGQFQALYDQVKSRRMGHLAGGIHRNGQPFFNVYFGGTRHS